MKPLRSALALCTAAALAATVAACGGSSEAASREDGPSASASASTAGTGTNVAAGTTTLRKLNGFGGATSVRASRRGRPACRWCRGRGGA